VVLFCEEQYELQTEAHSDWPVGSDYFFDSYGNRIPGIAEGRNARAKSSSATCPSLHDNRLEPSPFGLFHSFLGREVLETAVGASLPTAVAEKVCDAPTK
jgi:hypothetical protein